LQQGFEADYIRSLLRFLDWVIRLPEGLEQKLNDEMEATVEGKKMPYVTSWERRGEQKGIRLGKLQVVYQLVQVKWGRLDDEVKAQIESLTVEQLDKLVVAILKFTDLVELERWLKRKVARQVITAA
jgi:hypothetical protein